MSQNLVTVARFFNPVEADMFAAELRSANVKCIVMDDSIARMDILITAVNGGIRVAVAEKDVDTARELYNSVYANSVYAGKEDSEDKEKTEDEIEKDLKKEEQNRIALAILIITILVLILFATLTLF